MKSKNIWRLIIFGGLLPLTACMQSMAEPMGVPLYQQGEQGCHTYRIPALAITNAGTLLAFCEGRKSSMSDSGDIGIVLRRSEDNGGSWNEQQVVWDDPGNTSGNPCVVVDRDTGTIWLLMTWNRGDDHEGISSPCEARIRAAYLSASRTMTAVPGVRQRRSRRMSNRRTGPGTPPGRAVEYRSRTDRTRAV